jgi:hypothetical protein
MAELKTKKTENSVEEYLAAVPDNDVRKDCLALKEMMEKISGVKPKVWGSSILGFGDYHYVYESGREGDWFVMGFSPKKSAITLYFMSQFKDMEQELSALGKFKTGKGCVYIRRLADINTVVLNNLLEKAWCSLKK